VTDTPTLFPAVGDSHAVTSSLVVFGEVYLSVTDLARQAKCCRAVILKIIRDNDLPTWRTRTGTHVLASAWRACAPARPPSGGGQ